MFDFNLINQKFKDYVYNFNLDNKKIMLKYYHSIEVANISYELANKLNLSEEEKNLAKLIGYLHDIGRFNQVTITGSFKDKNIDHADIGIKILFEEGLIRNFINDNKYDEIIKKAIKYHNKYKVPDSLSDKEKLFTNIIRDSDKIDIFRVKIENYNNVILEAPSSKIIKYINDGKPINIVDTKNKTDSLLCTMAFIFDFNYKESIKILKDKGYYKKFLDSIEVNDSNKELFNEIKNKLLERLEV